MSDKTDPRRYRCCGHCQPSPNGGCGDMWGEPKDSHEVACPHGCNESLPPGIVRVDTRDEALVERLAPMLHPNGHYSAERWAGLSDEWREFGREVARAVLAALREES